MNISRWLSSQSASTLLLSTLVVLLKIIRVKNYLRKGWLLVSAVFSDTEDLSMVTSELDNVMDTEEPPSTSPEVRSLNLKVQDCESHLSLAMDKGDQLAVHFSPQDQNEMSALLGSLKTRIHQVKRQTSLLEENQPSQGSSHEEHETIEKLIAELLQLENEIIFC